MAINHKITVTFQFEEDKIEISGVLSKKSDRVVEVLFREDTNLSFFRKLHQTDSEYVYQVDMFDPIAGVIRHDCVLLYIINHKLIFRVVREFSPTDRRRHVKVKTNLYAQVTTFLHIHGKKTFPRKSKKGIFYRRAKHAKILRIEHFRGPLMVTAKEPMEIRIDDFNAGGMLFRCPKQIKPGRMFLYHFSDGRREIHIKTKILRQTSRNNSLNYAYGCQFVNLKTREEDMLCQFVFQLQAQSMRRERGM